jgi:type III pantothenate kinase
VATGGLASLVAAESSTIDECDDMLTLDGLRLIHARNR